MRHFFFKSQVIPWISITVIILFFITNYLVENLNERFWLNDFKVYYSASGALLNGDDPYGVAYGLSSGFYKYSPFTLLVFAPYNVFTYETAMHIHYAIISISGILAFLFMYRFINDFFSQENKPNPGPFLFIMFLIAAVHMTRELHLGNINLILILITLCSTLAVIRDKHFIAAAGLSFIFLLKPYFLILILPLIAFRKWKTLIYTALFTLGLLVVSLGIFGLEGFLNLHREWFTTMSIHSTGGFSEHTISSIVESYSCLELSHKWTYVFILVAGFIYGVSRLKTFLDKKTVDSSSIVADTFILLALIPNLVITDSQHFLFSLPLIGLLLAYIGRNNQVLSISLFVILLFFYGANSNDLLGNPLSDKFDEFSTIGVANLGLIAFTIYYLRKDLMKADSKQY